MKTILVFLMLISIGCTKSEDVQNNHDKDIIKDDISNPLDNFIVEQNKEFSELIESINTIIKKNDYLNKKTNETLNEDKNEFLDAFTRYSLDKDIKERVDITSNFLNEVEEKILKSALSYKEKFNKLCSKMSTPKTSSEIQCNEILLLYENVHDDGIKKIEGLEKVKFSDSKVEQTKKTFINIHYAKIDLVSSKENLNKKKDILHLIKTIKDLSGKAGIRIMLTELKFRSTLEEINLKSNNNLTVSYKSELIHIYHSSNLDILDNLYQLVYNCQELVGLNYDFFCVSFLESFNKDSILDHILDSNDPLYEKYYSDENLSPFETLKVRMSLYLIQKNLFKERISSFWND